MNYLLYLLFFVVLLFLILKENNYKEHFSLKKFISNNNNNRNNRNNNNNNNNNTQNIVQPLVPIYMPANSIINKNDINIIDLKPFYNDKITNDINNSINLVNKIYFSNRYLNNIAKNIDINDKKILR